MSCRMLLVLLGLCVLIKEDASSSLWAQGAYPRVMSPTGRFYGPTQAHYQYERQYGHPWQGGPAPFHPNTGAHFNIQIPNYGGALIAPGFGGFYVGNLPYSGYGYGYQNYGFPGFGIGGPVFNGAVPPYYGGPQFQYSWQQQFEQQQLPSGEFPRGPLPPPPGEPGFGLRPLAGGVPAPPAPRGGVVNVRPLGPEEPVLTRTRQLLPPQPSSLDQRARSVHFQGQGDVWLRQQNFLQAYSRYKQAASAASDQAAPHFRMAYALIALKRYDLAVTEMVRGIQLDPNYPLTGDGPAKVFGPENQIAAGALSGQVADWVRQEMQSPDRLFLLGAMLRMNGDLDRSKICFEAAAQLGGQPEPVLAFLRAGQPVGAANIAKRTRPRILEDERPPVPEAVEEMLRNTRNWVPREVINAAPVGNPAGNFGRRGNPRPVENQPAGPKLIGPAPLLPLRNGPGNGPGSEAGNGLRNNPRNRPQFPSDDDSEASPMTVPMESSPVETESDTVEPVGANEAVTPPQPMPNTPGFQPIPKKGSGNPPATPESGPSESGAQEGGGPQTVPESEPDSSGPVIPNPQSGQ